MNRTHYCGKISKELIGKEVTLCGWVRKRRDHGGLIFVDLTDYTGFAQVVFVPDYPEIFSLGESLRSEFVIKVSGVIRERPEGTINNNVPTGEVELEVKTAELLSDAETPPFVIQDETDAKEELRLRYRFLDLRRPEMQRLLRLRHRVYQATREHLDSNGFCEVETPFLTKTTPEGARDFLVPSRVNPGEFYALPQSPQIFKQVLMCSCFDRYYQIVRCFRDEDLRANRQPEFTQIDLEMSFVDEDQVKDLVEGLIAKIWQHSADLELSLPFPRLDYDEVMNRFGVDAPDMRFEMELQDISDFVVESEFEVFKKAVSEGGCVKGINLKAGAKRSRKDLDDLTEFVKVYDAKGLAWLKRDQGGFTSPIAKFLNEGSQTKIAEAFNAEDGDLILLVADKVSVVHAALGALRVHLAKQDDLIDETKLSFLWVDRFPLFEFDQAQGRFFSVHHPFTSPALDTEEDRKNLIEDPGKLKARAYDLVLNGQEIAGGSIRISQAEVQKKSV